MSKPEAADQGMLTTESIMKKAGLILLVFLGAVIPAAHAHRWHGLPQAIAWLAPMAFLFSRREFVRLGCQVILVAGAWITFDNMVFFIRMRQAMGIPWIRLAIILSVAALLPLAAAWTLRHPFFRRAVAAADHARRGTDDRRGDAERGVDRVGPVRGPHCPETR